MLWGECRHYTGLIRVYTGFKRSRGFGSKVEDFNTHYNHLIWCLGESCGLLFESHGGGMISECFLNSINPGLII